jgi:hypothetical protein
MEFTVEMGLTFFKRLLGDTYTLKEELIFILLSGLKG